MTAMLYGSVQLIFVLGVALSAIFTVLEVLLFELGFSASFSDTLPVPLD